MQSHSLENTCDALVRDANWSARCLVGGLLCFVPVVNILALGYLYQCGLQVRSSAKLQYPNWENWTQLALDGLIFLGIGCLFVGVPVALGWLVSELFLLVSMGYLGVVAYTPLAISLVMAPGLFAMALFRFQYYRHWSVLWDIRSLVMPLVHVWPSALMGSVFAIGLMGILMPLYGFGIFMGLLFVVYYFSGILKMAESVID